MQRETAVAIAERLHVRRGRAQRSTSHRALTQRRVALAVKLGVNVIGSTPLDRGRGLVDRLGLLLRAALHCGLLLIFRGLV